MAWFVNLETGMYRRFGLRPTRGNWKRVSGGTRESLNGIRLFRKAILAASLKPTPARKEVGDG